MTSTIPIAGTRRAISSASSLGTDALRWVVGPIATILVASFVVYMALALSPGDPVAQILGSRSTAEERAALTEQLGLNRPVVLRYFDWIAGTLQGDFGISYTYRTEVSAVLGPRVGTTALLVAMAGILILIVGVTLGSFGGVSKGFRPTLSVLIGLGVAIPGFVASLVLVSIFAVQLGWFPTFGGGGESFFDRVWHLTLPAIALSIGWGAYIAQITSASVNEEADKEHVRTAVGRGLPRALVFRKHVFRNAAIPVLTASGLTVAGLVAGSVVVESAFAIDGLGSLLARGVAAKDYALVAAVSLIIVAVFVVMTTLVDVAQTMLDPKRRTGGR